MSVDRLIEIYKTHDSNQTLFKIGVIQNAMGNRFPGQDEHNVTENLAGQAERRRFYG